MHKRRIEPVLGSIAIIALLLAFLPLSGCAGGRHTRTAKHKPAQYTAEELAEGFVVTRLMGSSVVRLADGVKLTPPPYEFFLTLTNPENQPKQVMFTSPNKMDLIVKRGDVEIFHYSKRFPAKGNPERVEIKPKGKKSWRMQWDGKLPDGKQLDEGLYTLEFILNTEPVQSVTFNDVSLKFKKDGEPG